MNGETYTIVGVMPAWYQIPGNADLWVPIDASSKGLGGRGNHHLRAIGRIKSGATFSQATADLRTVAAAIEKQFPDSNKGETAVLIPLREQITGNTRGQLLTLFGVVALVLLIACVNVANLLLARATGRKREFAMRAALGASRTRLVRQLLTESVMLALFGAVPGILLAYLCVSLLGDSTQMPFPRANPIEVNPMVLLFTIAVSVGIGILFGLAPAIQTSQVDLIDVMKSAAGRSGSVSGSGKLVRDALVVTEIAASLALLAGAALLIRTFANLRAVDIGVNGSNVLTAQILLPESGYGTYDKQVAFYNQLAEKLSNTAGLRAAGITSEVPMAGGNNGYVKIDGQPDSTSEGQLVEWTYITPGYNRTMGIPLLSGRELNDADLARTAEDVRKINALPDNAPTPAGIEIPAVISQTMAKKFWTVQDAVGKAFHANGTPMRVVGVVPDVKIFSLTRDPIPQAYLPLPWTFGTRHFPMIVVVRGEGSPEQLTGTVRSVVQSLDLSLAVFAIQPMKGIVASSMSQQTNQTVLLGFFAALALVLAAIGTYGVMSYLVTQRTGEIGIRMALGADRKTVLWLVLRQGLMLALVGIAVGIVGTIATSSLLRSMLFGVQSNDVLTLVAASGIMGAVALAACAIPALRAMRVEPVIALRYE